jgi:hypothetical protein
MSQERLAIERTVFIQATPETVFEFLTHGDLDLAMGWSGCDTTTGTTIRAL